MGRFSEAAITKLCDLTELHGSSLASVSHLYKEGIGLEEFLYGLTNGILRTQMFE